MGIFCKRYREMKIWKKSLRKFGIKTRLILGNVSEKSVKNTEKF